MSVAGNTAALRVALPGTGSCYRAATCPVSPALGAAAGGPARRYRPLPPQRRSASTPLCSAVSCTGADRSDCSSLAGHCLVQVGPGRSAFFWSGTTSSGRLRRRVWRNMTIHGGYKISITLVGAALQNRQCRADVAR
jgi:hypothetical protein